MGWVSVAMNWVQKKKITNTWDYGLAVRLKIWRRKQENKGSAAEKTFPADFC